MCVLVDKWGRTNELSLMLSLGAFKVALTQFTIRISGERNKDYLCL